MRIHAWGLNEWLVLVSRMCWCTLNTKDALDRLFPKDWVAKTLSNVRELLLSSPLNILLMTTTIRVVIKWSLCQLFLETFVSSFGGIG